MSGMKKKIGGYLSPYRIFGRLGKSNFAIPLRPNPFNVFWEFLKLFSILMTLHFKIKTKSLLHPSTSFYFFLPSSSISYYLLLLPPSYYYFVVSSNLILPFTRFAYFILPLSPSLYLLSPSCTFLTSSYLVVFLLSSLISPYIFHLILVWFGMLWFGMLWYGLVQFGGGQMTSKFIHKKISQLFFSEKFHGDKAIILIRNQFLYFFLSCLSMEKGRK